MSAAMTGTGDKTEQPVRIAMWSGPRNISTAMMRSFASRPDCAVVDEPFYAAWLFETGKDHPMRNEVIASQPTDWRQVVRKLTGPVPDGRAVFYQKHMTHHLLDHYTWHWLKTVTNCFLIRDPAAVLASYTAKWEDLKAEDLGFHQQKRIFDWVVSETGQTPVVVDAADILRDPASALSGLCAAVGIPWTDAMLGWEPGPKPYDGVWGAHWYGAVNASGGFAPYKPREVEIPDRLMPILDACRPLYEAMRDHATRPTASAG